MDLVFSRTANHELDVTPQSLGTVVALMLFGTTCTTTYTIWPAAGGAVGAAASDALTMSVAPNAWHGFPSDLAEHLTPLWIQIGNQRPEQVRISYRDFALADNSGFRYAAISPYTGQSAVSPAPIRQEPTTSGAIRARPPIVTPPESPAPPPESPPATPAEPPGLDPGDDAIRP